MWVIFPFWSTEFRLANQCFSFFYFVVDIFIFPAAQAQDTFKESITFYNARIYCHIDTFITNKQLFGSYKSYVDAPRSVFFMELLYYAVGVLFVYCYHNFIVCEHNRVQTVVIYLFHKRITKYRIHYLNVLWFYEKDFQLIRKVFRTLYLPTNCSTR